MVESCLTSDAGERLQLRASGVVGLDIDQQRAELVLGVLGLVAPQFRNRP